MDADAELEEADVWGTAEADSGLRLGGRDAYLPPPREDGEEEEGGIDGELAQGSPAVGTPELHAEVQLHPSRSTWTPPSALVRRPRSRPRSRPRPKRLGSARVRVSVRACLRKQPPPPSMC